MTAPTSQDTQDARILALEERFAAATEKFGGELGELETRMRLVERGAPVLSAGGTPLMTAPIPPCRRHPSQR